MDAKNLCLGALTCGDASGYEIKKMFEEGPFAYFHQVSFGSIYPALAKLCDQQLISMREESQEGRPDKKVVALMGDGSFGFTCGELETVVRKKMPITFIVFSNSVFGWIKAGQRAGFGERYYSVDFDRSDHAAIASAFGVKSWKVEDPEQLQSVLKQAVEHDGPTLVDVISQPLNEAAAPVSEWIA